MKTTSVPSPISLNVILLTLLFAAVVYIGVTGKRAPLLSNVRTDIILLIGMVICSQGWIGRVAAIGQWLHPLSKSGYILGGLILLVMLAVFVGWIVKLITRMINMSQTMIALSFWLHSVATVVFIGHHLLFSLIYLPAFAKNRENLVSGTILSEISKRSRFWMYASLAVFIVTGIYLMFVDPNYLGVGNFNNIWSIMMLVKHILILGMLGMGFWYNGLMRVGPLMSSNTGASQAIARFRQYSNLMAITGILVLLLTAISQAQ